MIDYNKRPQLSDELLKEVTDTLAIWLPLTPSSKDVVAGSLADWGQDQWLAAEWIVYWQNAVPWLVERIVEDGIVPPSDVAERLATINGESRDRSQRMLDNAVELIEALARRGIEAVPLKGAAIAPLYYEDPLQRMMGDLDMLVHRRDLESSVTLLKELNYRYYSRSAEDEVFLRGERDPMIWAADNVHPVELHYALREEYAGLGYNLEAIVWQNSHHRPYWNGSRARTPDPATLLHHVCAHATSDWLIQRGRLMQIDDIKRICDRMSTEDWRAFELQVGSRGARFVFPALAFTARYARISVPEPILNSLRPHCPPALRSWTESSQLSDNSRSSAEDRSGLGLSIAGRIALNRKEKAEVYLRSLFPRRWNLSKRYPKLTRSPVWPIGYVLINMDRLIRLARKV